MQKIDSRSRHASSRQPSTLTDLSDSCSLSQICQTAAHSHYRTVTSLSELWPGRQATVKGVKLNERIPQYLSWRSSMFVIGSIAWITKAALWRPAQTRDDYKQFLAQILGTVVNKSHFDGLLDALVGVEYATFVLDMVALLTFLAAAYFASPMSGAKTVKRSRTLTYISWLLAFVPFFLVYLVFPFRILVIQPRRIQLSA